jgi:simple sugar transport system permease protein
MNPDLNLNGTLSRRRPRRGTASGSPQLRVALVIGASVALAMLAALALIAVVGVPLRDAVAAFADGAWGSPYAIGASVNRSLAFASSAPAS